MQGYNRGVVGDTLITMWDLSQKPISQLKIEDEILAYDEADTGTRDEKPPENANDDWEAGQGFDGSHTGYNAHTKGIIKQIPPSRYRPQKGWKITTQFNIASENSYFLRTIEF